MDWLRETDWPADLQQFIEEFACSPLSQDSGSIDSKRLSLLAKTHAKSNQDVAPLSAALFLVANDLDASHTLSQDIHTKIGSYLHGIMHRREKDFSNAKYWFYQAGSIDCFSQLTKSLSPATTDCLADYTGKPSWSFDPVQLTDWHAAALRKSDRENNAPLASAIEDIAWQEWRWITNTVIKSRQ